MEKNLPEKRFTTGVVTATVWKNQGQTKTGQSAEYYTVSLQRRYKDKSGKWQSTSSFRLNDLPKASLVLNKAYEHLVLREQDKFNDDDSIDFSEEDIIY